MNNKKQPRQKRDKLIFGEIQKNEKNENAVYPVHNNIKEMKSEGMITPQLIIDKKCEKRQWPVKSALKMEGGILPKIFCEKTGNAWGVFELGIIFDKIMIVPDKMMK